MFQHSLYQDISIQAAVICKTRLGSSRHVAVPIPGPAGSNFKYHYSSGIPRITLFDVPTFSLIFIQAAIIFKTRPGSSRNVAVPVPELAISIFQIILFIRDSENYIIYDVLAFSLSSYFYSS